MKFSQSIEDNPVVGYAGNVLRFFRVTEEDIRKKFGKFKYYDFVGNAAGLETVLSRCRIVKKQIKYFLIQVFFKFLL